MAETNMLEIAKNLRLINKWRLGNDERLDQPKPADISRWLDAAADALEVGVDAAEARESASAYAHLLAIACSDLEQKSGQLWHAEWEADYIEEAIREFEAVKCELIRQVAGVAAERDKYAKRASLFAGERDSIAADCDRLRGHVAELEAEIERWRVATASLRDAAEESGRVANEQLARAEQRVAELEAWQAREASAQVEGDAEIARLVEQVASLMKERDEMRTAAEKRYEEFRREAHAHFVAAGEIEKLERDIADITEVWGHEITDYLKARAEGRARAESAAPAKTCGNCANIQWPCNGKGRCCGEAVSVSDAPHNADCWIPAEIQTRKPGGAQ